MEELKIELFSNLKDKNLKEEILKILTKCDKEFIPALSSRESTTQTDLSGGKNNKETDETVVPYQYFKNLLSQQILIATIKEKVVGFMSFRQNFSCEYISKEYLPNLYVSTVIVDPVCRGKGITKYFYKKLNEIFFNHYIFTRTWGTNAGHLKILNSLGFELIKTIKDDRGKGIDTVYYMWKKDSQLKI